MIESKNKQKPPSMIIYGDLKCTAYFYLFLHTRNKIGKYSIQITRIKNDANYTDNDPYSTGSSELCFLKNGEQL